MSGSAGCCWKITTSSTPLSAATTCAVWPTPSSRRRNSGLRPTVTRSKCFTAWPSRCARRSFKTARRVRVYLPVGELLPGISYLIRRLMENTSNTSFLRQTYADRKDIGALIKAPARPLKRYDGTPELSAAPADLSEPFRNEPPIDFSRRQNRQRFAKALEEVREQFKKRRVRKRSSGSWLESVNPADPKEVVGQVRAASIDQAETAIETAARFFPEWRATPAAERAKLLAQGSRDHAQETLGTRGVGSF